MKIPIHPGDQLDHYRIDGVADHNSSTSVFRAIERFQREEEIGKSLDHPSILKVFADEHRSQSYIVTEWFDGQPLRQVLAENNLSHERAVRIVLNVCNALAYIQNHGIVHRDLRPENILVDVQDHIKLA